MVAAGLQLLFSSVEGALWFPRCSHKNRIYSFNAECHGMCQSLDEFIKSRSLHLNQIAIWTSICKYYAAKVDLNMNPTCSARLCMNRADARFCLLTLHTQRAWRSSAVSTRTCMNNSSRTVLRVTSRAFYHFIWVKLASYHTHTEL